MPTTSGIAPACVATSGVPQLMASTAGRENPSYSDGTQATSADASSSAISESSSPDTTRTRDEMARSSIIFADGPSGSSLETSVSSTSRSALSLAIASSSGLGASNGAVPVFFSTMPATVVSGA